MIEAPSIYASDSSFATGTSSSTPMIAVRGLTKKIGRQEILRGVDLRVAKGETLAIIGRSGGGKSVLLKHLIGLMSRTPAKFGSMVKTSSDLSERKLAAIRSKVGILFQGGALFDSMTVEENIAFPLREAGERDPEVICIRKVGEMLEVIELEGQEEQDAGELERRNEKARWSGARDHSSALLHILRRADFRPRSGRVGQHQPVDPPAADSAFR